MKKPRRSRRRPHPGRPTAPFDAPNAIWSADFKGHFKTLDGRYCYPLTVQDGFSRYLLACQGLEGTTYSASVASLLGFSVSSACPSASAPTTARPSLPLLSAASLDSPSGGSSSVSCPTSSSPPHRNKTAVTNACTKTSKPRPPSPCRKPFRSAEALQLLPYRLQPDPSSRSPRPEAACFRLSTLDPLVPDEAEHTRLPCSLRSPQSLKEWRYPMALPLDQRLSPARWRLHRFSKRSTTTSGPSPLAPSRLAGCT